MTPRPATRSSHVKVKLPANASATHYIVVREYAQHPMTFTVELKGGPADFVSGCSDGLGLREGRQGVLLQLRVDRRSLAGKAGAYRASLACAANPVCPRFVTRPDNSAPECNQGTHKCELVKPADIKCGGFIAPAMQHKCPAGYSCSHIGPGLHPDVGGKCVQFCGGLVGIQCDDPSEECVDDPNDSCDPAHGGADCGGICL